MSQSCSIDRDKPDVHKDTNIGSVDGGMPADASGRAYSLCCRPIPVLKLVDSMLIFLQRIVWNSGIDNRCNKH